VKISVCIITLNAAATLDQCLASVEFADQIIVRDHGSIDATLEICRQHGARVITGPWEGFGHAKAQTVAKAENRWVLSLDADEVVTPELAAAIQALPEDGEVAAYEINRLSSFLGRWIRHCGWHPDWIIRLFDTEKAAFNQKTVHEGVETQGPIVRLDGLLKHYTYQSLEQYINKMNHYTTLGAQEAFDAGKRSNPISALIRAKLRLIRVFALQKGWMDGVHGVLLCVVIAVSVFVKYVKIWQLGRES
jgi:glycosyltransferase involved in cell wall biosynthesis